MGAGLSQQWVPSEGKINSNSVKAPRAYSSDLYTPVIQTRFKVTLYGKQDNSGRSEARQSTSVRQYARANRFWRTGRGMNEIFAQSCSGVPTGGGIKHASGVNVIFLVT
jgi:hypothetical protein